MITGRSIGGSFGEEESDRKPQVITLTKTVSCSVNNSIVSTILSGHYPTHSTRGRAVRPDAYGQVACSSPGTACRAVSSQLRIAEDRARKSCSAPERIDQARPACLALPMILQPRLADPNAAAHERVYRSLRQQVMHGDLAPGQALTLRGLAKQFGVSMTPVREAARRLVAEGAFTLSSSGRLSTPELTPERIEELAAIRALLEPELASRALPRAHFALIDRLTAINALNQDAVMSQDAVGYLRTNLEFHRTLYLRAQAPAMLAICETVWLQLGPTMRALYQKLRRSDMPHHHRMILAALRAGDEPGLRLAVRTDVTQGLRLLAA